MLQLAYKGDEGIPPIRSPLEAVFEQHNGMVFRTAYRITGNAADAEDVLQTVFLRMLRRDDSAAELQNAESYLRRAAINVSLDILRERQSRQAKASEAPVPAGSVDPELRHALRDALATLDSRQAEMFVLRFFEGYSNAEIAHLLGVNKLLVAVTIHRTRQRLQKQLHF
ncbi:MAG TPA: RNA polymerase sigma factor [Bryobacteraceae bacterium]|nr:RNA polymerase sigma factor [Bryobacteraceae bacterium]